jgi:hypothetical protein
MVHILQLASRIGCLCVLGPAVLLPLVSGRHSAVRAGRAGTGDLAPDVRFRMAEEILRRIKPKLTLPAENLLSTEKILEALAYERRASGRYS